MGKHNNVVSKSIGWSFFSEVAAKFIVPITNMILARILTPEDFGVIAMCNMIISFADIITDAGFGKYLIQRDFTNIQEKYKYADVAFWSNISLSIVIFINIVIFRHNIGYYLHDMKYAKIISIASLQLVFTSISSIQIALLRRDFLFKKLGLIRIVMVIFPLFFTIPFAYFTRNYWALIIGNLISSFLYSLLLTIVSTWKPSFFYSLSYLKDMFYFSFWSLCEGIAHWIIFWFDTFLVAQFYSEYYVGLYKNSSNMVVSIMGMISATASPILFSALSRLQNDYRKFQEVYFSIQKLMAYLIFPMGIVLYCYQKVVTYILFGERWKEASHVVGAWGIMMMVSLLFYTFPAEIFKSRGIPKVLFFFQIMYLIFMIPISFWAIKFSFLDFVYIRCLCVVAQVILSLLLMKLLFKIKTIDVLRNLIPPFFPSLIIWLTYHLFSLFFDGNFMEFISLIVSGVLFLLVLYYFYKKDILMLLKKIEIY